MTIRVSPEGTIELDGVCPIEDAEKLQRCILADREAVVDWRSCAGAHTAVVQIMLAAKPRVHGPPRGAFLRAHVDPLLKRATA